MSKQTRNERIKQFQNHRIMLDTVIENAEQLKVYEMDGESIKVLINQFSIGNTQYFNKDTSEWLDKSKHGHFNPNSIMRTLNR
jgi:hypothetical protein